VLPEMLKTGLTPRSRAYLSFAARPQPNRHMMGNTMTASRQQRKLRFCRPGSALVLAALVAAGRGLAGPIGAATTERVVVDRNSGLAISGFDPVAYFTDAKALPGKGEFEQVVAGAAWRFRSAGNRAAFMADPDV